VIRGQEGGDKGALKQEVKWHGRRRAVVEKRIITKKKIGGRSL